MDLLNILVKLQLDKGDFSAELKKVEEEAKDTGQNVEDAGNKSGGKLIKGFADKMSAFGGKLSTAGQKAIDFGAKVSIIGDSLTNKITKPALEAGGAIGKMLLSKGWERMASLDQARAKLNAMKLSGEEVDSSMQALRESVDGTKFSSAQMANVMATAVSMNYRYGDSSKSLNGYLQTTADLATFAGTDLEYMGSVMGKAANAGKLTGDTLQSLQYQAVPVMQWLQEEFNATSEEVSEMVKNGEISFSEFEDIVEKHIGGAAQTMGDATLTGALESTSAYIGLIGQSFLGSADDANSFAGQLLPLVQSFNEWLVSMSDKASEWGAVVGEVFGAVVEYIRDGSTNTETLSGSAQTLFGVIQPIIDAVQRVIEIGQRLFETLGPEKVGMIIAAVLGAGPIISLIGNIVGGVGTLLTVGGSLISAISTIVGVVGPALVTIFGTIITVIGPVGIAFLAVSAIIGAVAVAIYKNWDKIKAKASELAGKLSAEWGRIKANASAQWNAIKTAIITPIQNAWNKVKAWVGKLKALFPLKVGKIMSGIKVPKINISGGKAPFGIGGKGTKPSISVSWNKKAMENPYMFSGATLFGAGEAGDEVLYGRKALMEDIRQAVGGNESRQGNNVVINVYATPQQSAREIAKEVERIFVMQSKQRRKAAAV